jgi:hypothetical protein
MTPTTLLPPSPLFSFCAHPDNSLVYGKYDLDNEEEIQVMRMMETVYDFETQIIDLLDSTYIDFFMIDQYKEQCGVRNWPTRLC